MKGNPGKKFLSLFLSVVMVLGMLPTAAFATEEAVTRTEHNYVEGSCVTCGQPESSAEDEGPAEGEEPVEGEDEEITSDEDVEDVIEEEETTEVDADVEAVQAMINALPVDASSLEEAIALEAAMVAVEVAMVDLGEEKCEQLDLTKLEGAMAVLAVFIEQEDSMATLATKNVAEVNGKKYTSLYSAVSAAQGTGHTVEVLTDINESFITAIPVWKDLEIDLNGHSVTFNGFFIVDGNVTIKNGALIGKSTNWSTVQTWTVKNSADTMLQALIKLCGAAVGEVELTLNDVNVHGVRHALRAEGGDVTINGGEYTLAGGTTNYAINVGGEADSFVEINDAKASSAADAASTGGTVILVYEGSTVKIHDGTYASEHRDVAYVSGTLEVDGGTYTSDVTEYCVEGYEAIENDNGTWTVQKEKATVNVTVTDDVTVEDTFVSAVADALADANENVGGTLSVVIEEVGDNSVTYNIEAEDIPEDGLDMTLPVVGMGDGATAYVVHTHGKTLYVYAGVVSEGCVSFTNEIGFSEFTVTGGLQTAIEAAQDGDTIKLMANIQLTETLTISGEGKKVIDLNGYTITGTVAEETTALVYVTGGCELTLRDSSEAKTGGIHAVNTNGLLSNLIRVETDAKLVIESGNYTQDASVNGAGMIDSRGDEIITVKGGNFRLDNIGSAQNGSPWIFNASSQNTKNIIVTGGTYNADVFHQYYIFEVKDTTEVAELLGVPAKAAKDNGDGTWTIVDAVALVNEQHKSGEWYTQNTGYATLQEAIDAVKTTESENAEYVTLLSDSAENVKISKSLTLELNGKKFNGTIKLTDAATELTAPEGLNVITNVAGYKVAYENGTYKLVEADPVAQIGETTYTSLQAAIDAADNDTIVLLSDINIADVELQTLGGEYNTCFLVEKKTVTIDMADHTISGTYTGDSMLVGVFSTDNNGHLTLTGNGKVDITAANTVYSLQPDCQLRGRLLDYHRERYL